MLRKQAATYRAVGSVPIICVVGILQHAPRDNWWKTIVPLIWLWLSSFIKSSSTPSKPSGRHCTAISDHQDHVMLALLSARELAVQSIKQVQDN